MNIPTSQRITVSTLRAADRDDSTVTVSCTGSLESAARAARTDCTVSVDGAAGARRADHPSHTSCTGSACGDSRSGGSGSGGLSGGSGGGVARGAALGRRRLVGGGGLAGLMVMVAGCAVPWVRPAGDSRSTPPPVALAPGDSIRPVPALDASGGRRTPSRRSAAGDAASAPPWDARLGGDTVALLGEVHDNAEHHRVRTAGLRRACAAGWRPVLVMEQFDIDRQADLDEARHLPRVDAAALIRRAAPSPSGWDWRHYEEVVALALEHRLPLRAGNLSAAMASRVVRGGLASVFEADRIRQLGLDRSPDPAWQSAQEREIDAGHCGALPAQALPRMAQAQFARDAVMAEVVRRHAAGGVVLLAGNGHVRRDIGVPRWLDDLGARVWSVGFLEGERATPAASATAFDAVVLTRAAERPDPCEAFRRR